MPVPHQQRCMRFHITMALVAVILHQKWKNKNNNDAESFDTTSNSIDNVDEDNNDNDDSTNDYLVIINQIIIM